MKRRSTTVNIKASRKIVEKILNDAASFITNWPYVVKISSKNELRAEILLPRFVFKFGDEYSFTVLTDSNSYIYEGTGKKSHLIATITLKEWQKYVSAEVEVSYHGRGEFLLGKPLSVLVNGIAKSLEKLAENPIAVGLQQQKVAFNLDFSDPMSVARFLAKSKMAYSGLHIVQKGRLLDVVGELRQKIVQRMIYISGITSDGLKAFKLLIEGSQILALEYRDSEGVRTVKVKDDTSARNALEIISGIEGVYMLNVWVPLGGV